MTSSCKKEMPCWATRLGLCSSLRHHTPGAKMCGQFLQSIIQFILLVFVYLILVWKDCHYKFQSIIRELLRTTVCAIVNDLFILKYPLSLYAHWAQKVDKPASFVIAYHFIRTKIMCRVFNVIIWYANVFIHLPAVEVLMLIMSNILQLYRSVISHFS